MAKKIKIPALPNDAACHDITDALYLLDVMVEVQEARKQADAVLELGKKAITDWMKAHDTTSISMNGLYANLTKYTQLVLDQTAFKTVNPNQYRRFTVTKTRERFSFGREETK